jgi:hypothetical protein
MKNTYSLTHRVRLFVAGLTGLTVFIAHPLPAAQANGGKPEVAVTVVGPVEVQGAVEVVNDALKIPYNKHSSQPILDGSAFATVIFPQIPVGKRLVIETLSAIIAVPAGQAGYSEFSVASVGPNGQAFLVPLAVTPQGTYGNESRYIGTHKVKIIIDSRMSYDLRFSVVRTAKVGLGWYNVSINGYLEDVPALSP